MASSKINCSSEFRFSTIPRDTVLDSVKTTGLYYCDGVYWDSSDLTHRYGMLIVVGKSDGTDVRQLYLPDGTNYIVGRYFISNAWGAWEQLIS